MTTNNPGTPKAESRSAAKAALLCVAGDVVLVAWTIAWWWPTSVSNAAALERAYPWAVDDCGGSTFLGILPGLLLATFMLLICVSLRPLVRRGQATTAITISAVTVFVTIYPFLANLIGTCIE